MPFFNARALPQRYFPLFEVSYRFFDLFHTCVKLSHALSDGGNTDRIYLMDAFIPYAMTLVGGWVVFVTVSLFNQRQEIALLKQILTRIERQAPAICPYHVKD